MDGDSASGGLSVGQQDPTLQQDMQHDVDDEQAVEGGFGADPFETAAEQRDEDRATQDHHGQASADHGSEDYHPAQPDQPDREGSEGLTGTGPAQP